MKTPQQIEEMAKEQFGNSEEISNAHPDTNYLPWSLSMAFHQGYAQTQKDLLESASEGFEDAWLRKEVTDYRGLGERKTTIANIAVTSKRQAAELLWQACTLSKMKEIQEKDERIKKLEEFIKEHDMSRNLS